jgi:SAM-dependent methyltransferase
MSTCNQIIRNWLCTKFRRRFLFLCWPATALSEQASLWKSENISNPADMSSNFPLRMMRYWFVSNALQDESKRLGGALTVIDVGCGKGIMRKYAGNSISARWVGLDFKVDRVNLTTAGYDELYASDFDQPLPVPDASADVVVCLHVLEHVSDPTFTLSELKRILRPGGLLLAGSPVAPRWIALARQWWLRRELRQGKRVLGQHINCFWPGRWAAMVRAEGIQVELLTGAYLLRWAGNPLENTQWWLRLNQLWGGLFPALGGEVYLMARHC